MSALYEIRSKEEEEHVYFETGPATSRENRADRGDYSTNCIKKCHSVALCVHTVIIVALIGVGVFLLQAPKTEVVVQKQQLTEDNRTSDIIQLMDRLVKAETTIVALKNAQATAESEMTTTQTEMTSLKSQITTLKAARNTEHSEMITLKSQITSLKAAHNTTKKEMATLNSQITTLKAARNNTQTAITTLKSQITTLKSARTTTQTDMTALKSQITILKSALATSDSKVADLKEAIQTPTVVFTAKRTDSSDIFDNRAIIFPTVQTNLGGGYDPSSGVFTAPHSGSYLLTTTVCSEQNKGVPVHLVAAGTALAATYKYNTDSCCTCTSTSGVAVLREGDTASVRAAHTQKGAMFQGNSQIWPSFAGMLVHKT